MLFCAQTTKSNQIKPNQTKSNQTKPTTMLTARSFNHRISTLSAARITHQPQLQHHQPYHQPYHQPQLQHHQPQRHLSTDVPPPPANAEAKQPQKPLLATLEMNPSPLTIKTARMRQYEQMVGKLTC